MIWTGELNDPYGLGGSVGLYDTTLRDGEQTVGVVLDPLQKLELARAISSLSSGERTTPTVCSPSRSVVS